MTTKELEQRRRLYTRALFQLATNNKYWERNLSIWNRWEDEWRDWWIETLERQASRNLPMALELRAKVVALRLEESNAL